MAECRCGRVDGGACECVDEQAVRTALLAIQRQMIEACRTLVEVSFGDIAPDAAVRGSSGRHRLTRSAIPGWRLTSLRDSSQACEQVLVLLPTGEILCERGSPHLTEDELTNYHWEIHGWVQQLLDRHGIRGWPRQANDLRRLAIDFHFAKETPRPLRTQFN